MSDFLDKLNAFRAEREFYAIMLANEASRYFYELDIDMSKERFKLMIIKFKDILEAYREANMDYYNWLRKSIMER